ncbi:MAG: hypothetical protein AABO58_16890 [Acidobacteriota bacterium]
MKRASTALLLFTLAACSSTKPVDMSEPRRVVGTENDVRIDAEVYGDTLGPNVNIPIKYDITNNRSSTILVADLVLNATYDADALMVTVDIGSEIPGANFLPRLISIPSGGKKSFQGAARVSILQSPASTPFTQRPNKLRLRVNFLGETKPFEKLIDIPEKAVHDPRLAEALFTQWVEGNETVVTNTLPMRWRVAGVLPDDAASSTSRGRRRGRS